MMKKNPQIFCSWMSFLHLLDISVGAGHRRNAAELCRRHWASMDMQSLGGAYKVNTTKTEALPLHTHPSIPTTLQRNFPYHWCPLSLKYLGIHLTFSFSTLYKINYPPLFRNISYLLHQWDKYPLSLRMNQYS